MQIRPSLLAAAAAIVMSGAAHAGPILIVNGANGTSEPGTTSSITQNLQDLHILAGNTVTVENDIPADLSPFTQVWDIRFSNNFALTASQQTQYMSYLQSGGGMFLMGENSGFMARNNSIFDFVSQIGGGILGPGLIGGCDGQQNVNVPFTGPNPVTSIVWACSGVLGSKGSGDWITERADGSGGSGIAWGVGDLANAQAGALTMILDVNFMQLNASLSEINLTKNLIRFVGDQVEPPNGVPTPGSLALVGIALMGALATRRRRA